MQPLFILLLIAATSSPAFAVAFRPKPDVICSGVYCVPIEPAKPTIPAKIKLDNKAIDAGMEEAREKAAIAH